MISSWSLPSLHIQRTYFQKGHILRYQVDMKNVLVVVGDITQLITLGLHGCLWWHGDSASCGNRGKGEMLFGERRIIGAAWEARGAKQGEIGKENKWMGEREGEIGAGWLRYKWETMYILMRRRTHKTMLGKEEVNFRGDFWRLIWLERKENKLQAVKDT